MQDVSGVYTSPFLHRDERKMALRARKETGPRSVSLQVASPELKVVSSQPKVSSP